MLAMHRRSPWRRTPALRSHVAVCGNLGWHGAQSRLCDRVCTRPRRLAFYRDVVGLALKIEDAGYAEFATEPARIALDEQRHADRLTNSPTATVPAIEVILMIADADT